jgi:hypothetical protein
MNPSRPPHRPRPGARPSRRGRDLPKPALSPADELARAVHSLYEEMGRSDSLFASPLGPVPGGHDSLFLPQFVYFGPNAAVDPVRLALFSGITKTDRTGSYGLLEWIHSLIEKPDIGQGLSLSIFPVVNVRELLRGGKTSDLSREDWRRSTEPEIALLRENARQRRFHGFLRICGADEKAPRGVVRTVVSRLASASSAELFSADDFDPLSVRSEAVPLERVPNGPLRFLDGDAFPAFEVELVIPLQWSASQAAVELVPLLRRLIVAYRGHFSFGRGL